MPESRLSWYWHRLRAMSAAEMALHARKKARQFLDARSRRDWKSIHIGAGKTFPRLSPSAEAPLELRAALQRDAAEILEGRWRAFGQLTLQVDDPPRWQKDYLANTDLATDAPAFQLNHRELPDGADVKLIWELSRWYHLVRLAMATYVSGDRIAGETCIAWLNDWVAHNPPFRGWNWTSALESGIRLVQLTWIDALLEKSVIAEKWESVREQLCGQIVAPHVCFTWRHKSFGSSANNHLIGELAGLIVAAVRWPATANWGAPINELQRRWEREVVLQFAEDGGNAEQALNYQLFSFEFCWQVRNALIAAGQTVSSSVEDRLVRAARFFYDVQTSGERWDYGDSDDAYVTPFFLSQEMLVAEWRNWIGRKHGDAIRYWLGEFVKVSPAIGFRPPAHAIERCGWWNFPRTGIAVHETGCWWLRWDLSPLGYLATAAHGHLDALHLSIWFKGVPFVVDPGTGAYYADKPIRNWLASRAAHNGPCPPGEEWPRRLGPFLWEEQHEAPKTEVKLGALHGSLRVGRHRVVRRITLSPDQTEWEVTDGCEHERDGIAVPDEFSVRWQFAPDTTVHRKSERSFVLKRREAAITIKASSDWQEVELIEPAENALGMDGVVSPSFRKVERAPFLRLVARPKPGESCVFSTTFVASAAS